MSPVIKRLSWGLALSLALNLFLLGFGSARFMRRDAHGADGDGGPHERSALQAFVGEPTADMRTQHHALKGARRQVADALMREPFERSDLESALRALRGTTQQGQELLHARLLEHIGKLSQDERRALAQKRFLHDLSSRPAAPAH